MKKILLILILTPTILIAQNACKTCSEFSKSKEWSKFIECVTKKIDQDGNINDYMCRATSYGFAFANLDSIKSFYKEDEYIVKKEALNLALIDFNKIIELDSTFANGIPFKLRSEIMKQLGRNYCNDMKRYCKMTNQCKDYERECKE
tara:strand:+ start:52 stop:492 length:441 start_codon:yes stop_codon:yes gene_type:complete